MKPSRTATLLISILASCLAQAQEFAGQFVLRSGSVALELEPRADGYAGLLSADQYSVELMGERVDSRLQGIVLDADATITFWAEFEGSELVLTLLELDEFGRPADAPEILVFERAGTATAPASPDGDVVINGRTLTERQKAEILSVYGIAPLPGQYWYDGLSGLYGVVGYPAFGFMLPGHDFGSPARAASRGDTAVLINGRELPQTEWLVWSSMLGAPILPGAYWLDAQGNAGYEGNPLPLVNLYVAAQANAYSSGGGGVAGGGDNFWSSRFSAGNSNADNSQGYVSVPGYGPVGYGF